MIYKHLVNGKKSVSKDLVFDVFEDYVNLNDSEDKQKFNRVSSTYNFDLSNGQLLTGYGFKDLSMPTNTSDMDNETLINVRGNEITAIWSFRWFDFALKDNKYYIVYFNDGNYLEFANLFHERPLPLYAETHFNKAPIGCPIRYEKDDALLFSSDVDGLFLLTGAITKTFKLAPRLLSLCSAFDKIFAVIANDRASLMYTDDKNISHWTENNLEEIKFDDERGKLNKVILLNDYVYVIRDFGISRISVYSTSGNFDISQLYQSDSYIFPGTIASSGDKIYFLEGSGIFAFNGSSTSKINLDCDELLKNADKRNASAVCFEGKYYLSCRYDFNDGQTVGCESNPKCVNNLLLVLDLVSKKVNVLRGVDIHQLCVLNNPYKSKVVACFNGEYCNRIGELTNDGIIFDNATQKIWTSVLSTLSYPEKLKRVKFLNIKTKTDCDVVITSEKQSRTYHVYGSDKLQQIKVDVTGRELQISFKCNDANANISNVKLIYNVI